MLRFLITDDNDVTHAYMRHILLSQGDVTHAFSGRQAVEACASALDAGAPFDCVFLDMLMPGMDGWETLRGVLETYESRGAKRPKIIVVSCLTPAQYRADCKLPCQEDAYVRKPFDSDTLLAALAKAGLYKPDAEGKGEDFW